MTENEQLLQNLIENCTADSAKAFFRRKNVHFKAQNEALENADPEKFSKVWKIGRLDFEGDTVVFAFAEVKAELSERTCRKAQFEAARKILRSENADAGLFIFKGANGAFRLSLVYTLYEGNKARFSHFRRFTFFVQPGRPNKTFIQQIGPCAFQSLEKIKAAFSVEAVSDSFYNEFKPRFDELAASVTGLGQAEKEKAEDFALLLVIRTIFLGFIQKRGWLGGDTAFLQSFRAEFEERGKKGTFFSRWLEPLFFEALNTPPGHKVAYQNNEFSPEMEKKLQMAPFLNGGLFCRKKGYDDRGWAIPDKALFDFFDFLFQYNFTIEENALYDEDLELNPEFLGIIFERLVNKEDGAVYTPREEVDLMCRLSLVKWLEKNNETGCQSRDLYELFFRELGDGNSLEVDQRPGSFSERQAEELIRKLENITVCDPAVGSGAFPVGMMHVIDDTEMIIWRKHLRKEPALSAFERKQRIIQGTLYGVEVKEWAVWICQLRLWISLFIEADDKQRNSLSPLLPSLDFKIRRGDSLVQMIGGQLMAVCDQRDIARGLEKKISELQDAKNNFFQNRTKMKAAMIRAMETALFRSILDEQITLLKRELRITDGRQKVDQLDLIRGFSPAQQMKQKGLFEQQAEALTDKIAELEDEKRGLNDDHPLIWNIEFAEIFAERGGFDIVIGNPPYVRHEDITDPSGKLEAKAYKDLLGKMIKKDFPDAFGVKEKINAKSDLYTYFYLRGLRLLNERGVHTFICSNSWLDVGYGAWLQKFLLENCHIRFIVDNHARRSFKNAEVNTIISVIDAPQPKDKLKTLGKEIARFVAFKRPFEETVFTENLLEVDRATSVIQNDSFRVYPATQSALKEQGVEYDDKKGDSKKLSEGNYAGDKWGGKYLRAPDIYWKIMDRLQSNGIKQLRQTAEVKFGIKSGVNAFFHLDPAQVRQWAIEPRFLRPLIKTPRDYYGIKIPGSEVLLFWCQDERESLKGTKALAYIEWGEEQGFHKTPSCASRRNWYSLKGPEKPALLWPSAFFERHIVYECPEKYIADKVFYTISGSLPPGLNAYLNSSIVSLFVEVEGYQLNHGGIFVTTDWLANLPVIAVPESAVLRSYEKLTSRDILLCGDELEEKSRKELDLAVLKHIGLGESEMYEMHEAIKAYVAGRIHKARRETTQRGRQKDEHD
jgi:hypothetical protein